MIGFDDDDYGDTDILKGLLAGVAGGLLASFTDGAIPSRLERSSGVDQVFG